MELLIVLVMIILTIWAGNYAAKYGRSYMLWVVISILITPILSFIILLILEKKKPCPACKEFVKYDAIKCKFCGAEFDNVMKSTNE